MERIRISSLGRGSAVATYDGKVVRIFMYPFDAVVIREQAEDLFRQLKNSDAYIDEVEISEI